MKSTSNDIVNKKLFLGKNSVSFPERYSKSEKGWAYLVHAKSWGEGDMY